MSRRKPPASALPGRRTPLTPLQKVLLGGGFLDARPTLGQKGKQSRKTRLTRDRSGATEW